MDALLLVGRREFHEMVMNLDGSDVGLVRKLGPRPGNGLRSHVTFFKGCFFFKGSS